MNSRRDKNHFLSVEVLQVFWTRDGQKIQSALLLQIRNFLESVFLFFFFFCAMCEN